MLKVDLKEFIWDDALNKHCVILNGVIALK